MEAPFLATVLDSLAEGVFTINRDWKITSFNRAAERITGFTKQEVIARKCWDIFHAGVCRKGCLLKKTLDTHKGVLDHTLRIKSKKGKSIPISISTAVLKDWRGNIIGGVETLRDLSAIESLKKEIASQYTFKDIIGKNHRIRRIIAALPDIARSDSNVLIRGASGTGKEFFARAIHNLAWRNHAPFVVVHFGTLPAVLLESGLFSHLRGPFTDEKKSQAGRFGTAEGGTIFLDEIGDISPGVQARLLQVLGTSTYEPLGSKTTIKTHARVITATNRDLFELIGMGRFKKDLYYRIATIMIELPELRQRRDDIPMLIDHFIEKFNARTDKHIVSASKEVVERLLHYDFPDNVRELENIVEHAFVLCNGEIIELRHLPWSLVRKQKEKSTPRTTRPQKRFRQAEASLIRQTLKKHLGHRGRAARDLGIHKTTLWRRMKECGIKD